MFVISSSRSTTPISISTPHTYLSTGPFLPSLSGLSSIFSTRFTKAIKMKIGKLLSWPAPQQWFGHTGAVLCTSYSPNGIHVVTGSADKTIRIWDAETGAAVGLPLVGHNGRDWCGLLLALRTGGASSPDPHDNTIRIWDAETGAAVGEPLEGHNGAVWSVACSPDGRRIISGSS
jgi:WD40 repeat protein